MITVAFYKAPGTWRDWLIRMMDRHWTWKDFWKPGKYSHCEFVERLQRDAEGRLFSHCVAASKRDGNRVSRRVVYFKEGHWDFLTFAGEYETALLYFYSTLGTEYDTAGAVFSVTPIDHHNPEKLFCSEQMSRGVKLATVLDIEQPHRETPNSLFRLLCASRLTPHHTEA